MSINNDPSNVPQDIPPAENPTAKSAHSQAIASPRSRRFIPMLVSSLIWCLIGAAVWGKPGLIFGLIFGAVIVGLAIAASGHYPLDLHEGKILDPLLAPDTLKHVASFAAELKIENPVIYLIDLNVPQICVCASGYSRRVKGRIGITQAMLTEANEADLYSLMALAVSRIATGEASVLSSAASLSGVPLQAALAPGLNSGFDEMWKRSPDCELSPLGKVLLIIIAPFARTTLLMSGAANLALLSDRAACKLLGYSSGLASSLRWLADEQVALPKDPVIEFNPAEAALYLVSPFEQDFTAPHSNVPMPTWKRARFLITGMIPQVSTRISRLPKDEKIAYDQDEVSDPADEDDEEEDD